MSYTDCLGVDLKNPDPITDLAAGERVTVGLSSNPVWQVLAVHGDRAWMQRTDCPWIDGVGPIERLRRALA